MQVDYLEIEICLGSLALTHELINTVYLVCGSQLGSLTVSCYETPCHTTGHICYFVTSNEEDRAVFTGDTLFISGCGRFFEGSPHQMYHALCEVLATLPKDTVNDNLGENCFVPLSLV